MLTIPNINTSIENKNIFVLDDHARNGTFLRDASGRLIHYSGGFSVVFPYETRTGEKWAFRCWHTDVVNSNKRYQTISDAIKNAKLSFLCEFQYVEQGVIVEGNKYPTTRMKWIDGIGIKDYICQNRNSKSSLNSLAANFLKMVQTLHARSLAHGDLQHGNILVDKEHQLHLVDYDSFYCSKLRGEADVVTGLPDYQHPARANNKSVSEKLDYFSELIIYLSILAIAENPSLIDKYKVESADRLLFAKEDFSNITGSNVYRDIKVLGKEFEELLDVLEIYLNYSSIDELLPFDDFLLDRKISFTTSTTKVVRDTQTVVIEWNVPFEAEVELKVEGKKDVGKCKNQGNISMTLSKDCTYELLVKSSDGRKFKKEITIQVFDECEINFNADKYYVFPSIPVKLSWNVKHAKKVWLDNDEVEAVDSKVIEPDKALSVVLSAEDEFGKKEKQIDIKMLPIPQVKSLLIPTPNIVNNLSINLTQPRFNVDVPFPNIEIDMIKTEVPKVPSLSELGLNVELSPPLPRFSLKRSFKRIYNHITRK